MEVVGATSWLPVNGRYHEWGFQWDAVTDDGDPDATWNPSDVRIVSGDYFASMGVDLLRGVTPAQVEYQAEAVMWVNETIEREISERSTRSGASCS